MESILEREPGSGSIKFSAMCCSDVYAVNKIQRSSSCAAFLINLCDIGIGSAYLIVDFC